MMPEWRLWHSGGCSLDNRHFEAQQGALRQIARRRQFDGKCLRQANRKL